MKENRLFSLTLAVILFAGFTSQLRSQDIPEKPVPARLVNDLAGLLNSREAESLEQSLDLFNDSTSTQIAIVIVPTLNGYDKSEYAQRLGEKWGRGQKGKNNGILILVKPKTSESGGEAFITAGYGLEGAIPDLTCSDIVDNELIPAFRNGDYFGGLTSAVGTIMSLTRGEFTADEYGKRHKKSSNDSHSGIAIFIVIVVISILFRRSGGSNNRHIGTGGLPFWMLMGMLNSGRDSHGGSWGGFSDGGGGFGGGGGGGGFGGFGGGGFGGGGAGGSW